MADLVYDVDDDDDDDGDDDDDDALYCTEGVQEQGLQCEGSGGVATRGGDRPVTF